MPDRSRSPRSIRLPLTPKEHWTLHHVLLHRIDQERTAVNASDVDPPPLDVFCAFETLDDGDTDFTIAQCEALKAVLSEYQQETSWGEVERARIDRLLDCVTDTLEETPLTLRYV